MKISELNDYLTGYLISNDIKSLLINGKWGIGKTYTITQFLKKMEANKKILMYGTFVIRYAILLLIKCPNKKKY